MLYLLTYPEKVAELLLKAGANPYIKDKHDRTALDLFNSNLKKWNRHKDELTRGQLECVKRWEKGMPKLLKRAEENYRKKHKNELKDVAKIASTADKSINIHQKEKSGLTSGLATGSDVSDYKTKLPFKIGLLIIGLLAVAGIGEFIIKKHK